MAGTPKGPLALSPATRAGAGQEAGLASMLVSWVGGPLLKTTGRLLVIAGALLLANLVALLLAKRWLAPQARSDVDSALQAATIRVLQTALKTREHAESAAPEEPAHAASRGFPGSPDYARTQYDKGRLLLQQGKYDQARRALYSVLAVESDLRPDERAMADDVCYLLAEAYSRQAEELRQAAGAARNTEHTVLRPDAKTAGPAGTAAPRGRESAPW